VAELSDNSGELINTKTIEERSDVISTTSGQPLSISIITGNSKNQPTFSFGKRKTTTEHSSDIFGEVH